MFKTHYVLIIVPIYAFKAIYFQCFCTMEILYNSVLLCIYLLQLHVQFVHISSSEAIRTRLHHESQQTLRIRIDLQFIV